jgi:putative endonuclease
MPFFVYIMAAERNGTIYVGVTNDLVRRVWQHRNGVVEGFTKKCDVHRLVYFEAFDDARNAIQREKNIKHWARKWKLALIEEKNPQWCDLYDEIV